MSQPKQGNYFMLPNEIFNMDLTAEEIALYAFLMRMEDRKNGRYVHRKTRTSFAKRVL